MGPEKIDFSGIKTALITGGGGFVGKVIVKMLTERGVICKVIGRNHYPDIEALGVECLIGDISDPGVIITATQNVDTVFHVAALAGIWGKWESYYRTNVLGTENVINACRQNKVSKLIYTSTPSVVFDNKNIKNGDESLPYTTNFLCNYARSKAIAEKLVLGANSSALLTCAIRPHLVWGPDDPHLIPRLIVSGRKKKLKIVGTGSNLVDISYVDNVAYAHILAAVNLSSRKTAAGKSYFIGQEKPVVLWDWINSLFLELDIPQVNASVSFSSAYRVGTLLELIYRFFRMNREPRMTRFLAQQLAKSHYFSHMNAQNDLGYYPVVSTEEGMIRLVHWIDEYEKKDI